MTRTIGDLLADACDESRALFDGLDLTAPAHAIWERWDALAACLLAIADGRGPNVGAVSWMEERFGLPLRGANLIGANLSGGDAHRARLGYMDWDQVMRWL